MVGVRYALKMVLKESQRGQCGDAPQTSSHKGSKINRLLSMKPAPEMTGASKHPPTAHQDFLGSSAGKSNLGSGFATSGWRIWTGSSKYGVSGDRRSSRCHRHGRASLPRHQTSRCAISDERGLAVDELDVRTLVHETPITLCNVETALDDQVAQAMGKVVAVARKAPSRRTSHHF